MNQVQIGKRPIVQFLDVSKTFKRRNGSFLNQRSFQAVRNVSFTIYEQETFALVGSSGAGKSTIAKMLLGLIQPEKGKITVFDQELDVLLKQKQKWFRKKCQMVFQDAKAALSPKMRVRDLLLEALLLDKELSGPERTEAISGMLDRVGLSDVHASRYPSQLSGGEAQRVCIARALLREPELLVCDEPTANLDVSTERDILQLLFQLKKEYRMSILLITHNLSIVKEYADRVGIMAGGELIEVGSNEEIFVHSQQEYTKQLISNY